MKRHSIFTPKQKNSTDSSCFSDNCSEELKMDIAKLKEEIRQARESQKPLEEALKNLDAQYKTAKAERDELSKSLPSLESLPATLDQSFTQKLNDYIKINRELSKKDELLNYLLKESNIKLTESIEIHDNIAQLIFELDANQLNYLDARMDANLNKIRESSNRNNTCTLS